MSRTPFLAETAGFEPACPKGANAFRVRLVMTASIRLHVFLLVVRVFATCVARRGIYGIGAVFWSAVRVFATCVARRGIYGIGAISGPPCAYSQLALLIRGLRPIVTNLQNTAYMQA